MYSGNSNPVLFNEEPMREPVTESRPVEPEKPAPVSNNSKKGKANRTANLRKSPDSEAEVLDVVMRGAKIDILGTGKGYYKIKYGSNTGYVKKNCVDEIW